ncbi:ABC transporter permease [Rhodococcus sp. NPDC058521]|uniref:ABC transporter permease n=1 Tax=Rhodococcus sp. NPDC058521 TaxID=3346536 RepID=UPI0036567CCF
MTTTVNKVPVDQDTRKGPPDNVKLIAVVLGLTVVISLMLLAFVLPSINSGPHELKFGVAGPGPAVEQIENGLTAAQPDAFDVQSYDDEAAVRTAIEHRDIVGGIVVTEQGPTMLTASAGGQQIAQVLTGVATGLGQQTGAPVPVEDVVPLPEGDPAGVGLGMLAFPLVFGGMVPAIALVSLFPRSLSRRIVGAVSFAVLAGLVVAAIMQFGIGSFDDNYLMAAGGVAIGIAAISLTILGLESLLGYAGLGIGAVTMMFIANPLSGMATTSAWLPSGWGALGQLLPPGAAGTAIRSIVYFDGHGAGHSLVVLATWIVVGVGLCVVAAMRNRSEPSGARS